MRKLDLLPNPIPPITKEKHPDAKRTRGPKWMHKALLEDTNQDA